MLRMPRPQPTMSLRQQESGTECEAREKVVLTQSRYDWVPQHPSCDDTVLSELWDERTNKKLKWGNIKVENESNKTF